MGWDALGRLTSSTASSRTLSYQWDLAGNRTRVTWLQENGATTGAENHFTLTTTYKA